MLSRKNRITQKSDAPPAAAAPGPSSTKSKDKAKNIIKPPESDDDDDDDDVQILEVLKKPESRPVRSKEEPQHKQENEKCQKSESSDKRNEKRLNGKEKDKKEDAQVLKLQKTNSKSRIETDNDSESHHQQENVAIRHISSSADPVVKRSEKPLKEKDKQGSSGENSQHKEIPLVNKDNTCSRGESVRNFPKPQGNSKQADKPLSESEDDEDEDSQEQKPASPELSPRSGLIKYLTDTKVCIGRIRRAVCGEPVNDGITQKVYWDSFSPPPGYTRDMDTIGMPPEPEIRLSPSVRMFHLMGKNANTGRRTKRPNKLEEDVKAFKLKLIQENKFPAPVVKNQTSNAKSPITSRNSELLGSRRINFNTDLNSTTDVAKTTDMKDRHSTSTERDEKYENANTDEDDLLLFTCTQTIEEGYQNSLSGAQAKTTSSNQMSSESSSTHFSPIKPIVPSEPDKLIVKRKLWEPAPVYQPRETETKKFKTETVISIPATTTTTTRSQNFDYQETMEEDGEGDDFLSQLVLPQLSSQTSSSVSLECPIGQMVLDQNSASTTLSDNEDDDDDDCFDSDFMDAITKLEEKELAKSSSSELIESGI